LIEIDCDENIEEESQEIDAYDRDYWSDIECVRGYVFIPGYVRSWR
jgi:hypothetical protein